MSPLLPVTGLGIAALVGERRLPDMLDDGNILKTFLTKGDGFIKPVQYFNLNVFLYNPFETFCQH